MSETRAGRAVVYVLPVMLLACALAGAVMFYLVQRPKEVRLGRLSAYPPIDQPYQVQLANEVAFLVNTGSEVLVIDPRFTSSNGVWNCLVKWVPTNGRFEDPCSGAKFTLTGEWLDNCCAPPAVDHRGLGHYAVSVSDDQVWVALGPPTPSVLVATACAPGAGC
jgi:hypothetical protein